MKTDYLLENIVLSQRRLKLCIQVQWIPKNPEETDLQSEHAYAHWLSYRSVSYQNPNLNSLVNFHNFDMNIISLKR